MHIRSAIFRNFKQFCDLNDNEELIHRILNKPSIIKDEQDIQSITSVIMDRFGNPFSLSVECERPDPLINIATGVVASEEVTKDLLTSKEIRRKALEDYTKIRIQNQSVSMTKPIKRLNLKTFSTMTSSNARIKKHANNRIEEDRDLFGWLLVISEDKSYLPMNYLVHYKLLQIMMDPSQKLIKRKLFMILKPMYSPSTMISLCRSLENHQQLPLPTTWHLCKS